MLLPRTVSKILRKLASVAFGVLLLGAAMPALAQSPNRTPPLDEEQQAEAAAESRRRAIAEFDVPIETEPAFIFKA